MKLDFWVVLDARGSAVACANFLNIAWAEAAVGCDESSPALKAKGYFALRFEAEAMHEVKLIEAKDLHVSTE